MTDGRARHPTPTTSVTGSLARASRARFIRTGRRAQEIGRVARDMFRESPLPRNQYVGQPQRLRDALVTWCLCRGGGPLTGS